jgi:hypothetical protein
LGQEERLLQEAATSCFCALAAYPQGRLTLFKTGGIVVLVKLLSAPAERVVAYALTTLHGLILYQVSLSIMITVQHIKFTNEFSK